VSWISEGWQIFTAAPGTWIAILIIFALIMIAVGLVPLLGALVQPILSAVLSGGVVLGCHALARGEPLTIAHLFEGFKAPRLSPLIVFGAINLGISIAIGLLFIAVFVAVAGSAGIGALMTDDPIQLGTGALMGMGIAALLAVPIALVAAAVLIMLWWFAPALIAIDGVAPWDAMKASFRASLGNIVPFLLYGLVMFALAIVATIPFGLGWLVLGPVGMGSLYASWRTVFSRA
jgi:uncharacterized membrane protein